MNNNAISVEDSLTGQSRHVDIRQNVDSVLDIFNKKLVTNDTEEAMKSNKISSTLYIFFFSFLLS
jgi:hypothetical protein